MLKEAKSGADLCSALCSTASQNLAAVCGGHSLAEAVLLGALELLGLISARSSHCQFTSYKEYRRPEGGHTYSTAGEFPHSRS